MFLTIMFLFAFLSCIISARLSWIFNNLKKNAKNKQVLPLANVMFVKSSIFMLMSLLIIIELICSLTLPKSEFLAMVHWKFGLLFVILLFISQLYLYWLAEIKNGWH